MDRKIQNSDQATALGMLISSLSLCSRRSNHTEKATTPTKMAMVSSGKPRCCSIGMSGILGLEIEILGIQAEFGANFADYCLLVVIEIAIGGTNRAANSHHQLSLGFLALELGNRL